MNDKEQLFEQYKSIVEGSEEYTGSDAEEIRAAAMLHAKKIGIKLDRFTKEFGRRMYIEGWEAARGSEDDFYDAEPFPDQYPE